MNKLPLEIEDKIWNMYWMDVFNREVISVFNDYESKMEKMIFFLKKHVYPSVSEDYDKQISYYLKNYNIFIIDLARDPGLCMFLKKKYPYLHYCFHEKYIESCFSKVDVSYKRICAYCMCAGVPYMNYYCLLRFINLGN